MTTVNAATKATMAKPQYSDYETWEAVHLKLTRTDKGKIWLDSKGKRTLCVMRPKGGTLLGTIESRGKIPSAYKTTHAAVQKELADAVDAELADALADE